MENKRLVPTHREHGQGSEATAPQTEGGEVRQRAGAPGQEGAGEGVVAVCVICCVCVCVEMRE